MVCAIAAGPGRLSEVGLRPAAFSAGGRSSGTQKACQGNSTPVMPSASASVPIRRQPIVSLRSALLLGFAVRRQKAGQFCCQKGRTTKLPHLPPPKSGFRNGEANARSNNGYA